MKFDKKPTDDQLDGLLGNISVPADLKARLLSIPSEQINEPKLPLMGHFENKSKTNRTTWISLVLAATLLGAAAFISWHWITDSPPDKQQSIAFDNSPTRTDTTPLERGSSRFQDQIALLEASQIEAEMLMYEIEMSVISNRIQNVSGVQTAKLEEREIESMILALADQTSLPLGGSEQDVKSDMASVITQYPNTRGAAIAQEYLDQTAN